MTPDDSPPASGHPKRPLPPRSVTVRCRLEGPLVVEISPDSLALGIGLRVTDHEGQEYPLPDDGRPLALCRCGHSDRKPFCDGSHKALPSTERTQATEDPHP